MEGRERTVEAEGGIQSTLIGHGGRGREGKREGEREGWRERGRERGRDGGKECPIHVLSAAPTASS